MDKTNAQEFRSNLKEWMDIAESEPIKITRKSGESFVLVNSEQFEKMQLELARFEGLTKSLIDSAQGRAKIASETSTSIAFANAKARAISAGKKKAVG